jgi:pimeloyl-ACP methyl ester carboxylesterase
MLTSQNGKTNFVTLLFLSIILIASFTLTPYSSFASTESNNTLMQPDVTQGVGTTTNATSTNTTIILVHGGWADGSSWGKVIPILKNAGHRVIAV